MLMKKRFFRMGLFPVGAENIPDNFLIAVVVLHAVHDLVIFVPLAGYEQAVIGTEHGTGLRGGAAPVGIHDEFFRSLEAGLRDPRSGDCLK